MNGTLSHICFVFPQGRAYLPGLSHLLGSFASKHRPRYAPPSVRSDVFWWSTLLTSQRPPRVLTSRGETLDLDIWVDAATSWGIGVCFGNNWEAWKLAPGWRAEGRDIGWAEGIAIELAVRLLESAGVTNSSVLIRSDNAGVIGAYIKGRSRNFQVNHAIRRVESISLATNVRYVFAYVGLALNKVDPISRGELGATSSRMPHGFELPGELRTLLVHV